MFTHKRIHKTTWVSPYHLTENQIDRIGIGKIFRRCDSEESRRGIRPPPADCQTETQVEEKLDGDSNKEKEVQCLPYERSTDKRGIKPEPC